VRFIHLYLFSFLLFILLGCSATTPRQKIPVTVERVVNGQTVEISDASGTQRLRLIGINAPTWLPKCQQEPWQEEAKNQLKQLVEGKDVLLEYDEQTEDNYDRQLGYLWQDEELLINEWLVQQGLVLASRPYEPNTKYAQQLAYAQEYARVMELGIWNWQNPMRQTPYEFRRLDCESDSDLH